MDFLGKGRINMNGIGKYLRYKKDKKDTPKERCGGNCKVKEKGNLGFVVFNSRTISGKQIQFFNSRACDKTHESVAEFMYNSAGEKKSLNHFTIDML